MKRILFVWIFTFSWTVMLEAGNCEVQKKEIYLQGFLTKPKPVKSGTSESVIVDDLDYCLYVAFTQNFGVLNVTVTDEHGCDVYQQSINTSSTNYLVIPTNNLHAGTYTITISGSEGSVTGVFYR